MEDGEFCLPKLMGDLRLTPTLTAEAHSALPRLRETRLVTDWFAVEFVMLVIWLWATVLAVVAEDIGPRLRDSIFCRKSGLASELLDA